MVETAFFKVYVADIVDVCKEQLRVEREVSRIQVPPLSMRVCLFAVLTRAKRDYVRTKQKHLF